jgi:hypothetical protein
VILPPDGNIFATDFYNHRVQKFRPDGTFLNSFGKQGTGPGEFRHPVRLAVASDGSVFVADFGNHESRGGSRPSDPAIRSWGPQPSCKTRQKGFESDLDGWV